MLPLIQNFETYYRLIEAYLRMVCNGTLLGLGNTAKMKSGMCVREGVKKNNRFFRTLSLTMGRWGSKVLNF